LAATNRNSAITAAQDPRRIDVVVDTNTLQRVALYARASTVRDQSPEMQLMQLKELTEYAQHRGWTVAGEFIDHGVSVEEHTPASE